MISLFDLNSYASFWFSNNLDLRDRTILPSVYLPRFSFIHSFNERIINKGLHPAN